MCHQSFVGMSIKQKKKKKKKKYKDTQDPGIATSQNTGSNGPDKWHHQKYTLSKKKQDK